MADQLADVLNQDGPEQVNAEESTEAKAQDAGAEEPQANANEGDESQEHQRKRLGGWQRKIVKLEDERDYWRELALSKQESKKEETKTAQSDDKAPVRPKMEDFQTLEAYEQAVEEYQDKKLEYKLEQRLKSVQAETEKKTEQQKLIEKFNAQCDSVRKQHADFDEVAFNEEIPLTDHMRDAIVTSEHGAEIAYFLGSNPEEAERIADMHPISAIRAIGKIEAAIASEKSGASEPESKPAPKPKAPKPPTPVKKPSPTAPVDLNDPNLPMEVWLKERNKQVYGK